MQHSFSLGRSGSTGRVTPSWMAAGLLLASALAAPAADFDPQPDPPRPQHWWSGDGHARDQAGAEHGTAVGGLKFVPGLVGQAFEFNGRDASVVFGVDAGNFGKSDFTIEFLVRSATAGTPFLTKRGRCAHDNFWQISDRLFELDETTGGLHYAQLRAAETLCDRIWHHVAVVRAGERFTVYRDGRVLATETNRFVTILDNLHPLVAGIDACNRRFTGQLDEIKLYDEALTDAQIARAAEVADVLQIRGQPRGGTFRIAPTSVTLVVDAYSPSSRSLRYQWFHGGRPIPLATRSGYTISPVTTASLGAYTVEVTDGLTTVTSDPAVVWVGPALLAPRAPMVRVEGAGEPNRFEWSFDPPEGQSFTDADLAGIDLEASSDLKIWTLVPGAVRLENGRVAIADPEAYAKRSAYYRVAYRDPALNRDVGGAIALAKVPADVLAAVRNHLTAFVGAVESRVPEDAAWNDVVLGPTARHVHDPAYREGKEPAFVELKVLDRTTGAARGYVLASLTPHFPAIVEFAMTGKTKTERALAEVPGSKPQKFLRFGAGFLAMEDHAGNLLGALGSMPGLPGGALPTQRVDQDSAYDSDAGRAGNVVDSRAHKPFLPAESYAQLRAGFGSNLTRGALRQLRTTSLVSRLGQLAPTRNRIVVPVGRTLDIATDQHFAKVIVDSDDEVPCVRVSPLPGGGFRALGVDAGSEIIRAWTVAGVPLTYSVIIQGGAALASRNRMSGCHEVVPHVWTAGGGWVQDQRQYHQLKGPNWCPVVGCGPTALLMLFGWWDAQGVPSAFYHLKSGFGDADDFRFDRESLRVSDAPQVIHPGSSVKIGGFPTYQPSPEEAAVYPVLKDLYDLCNTFCVAGQGATTPDELFDGATEYIDRAVRNLGSPENEFGESFLGAQLRVKYTDGYAFGMTDWEGGGVMVANDIKKGRPGIVGLGDTLFDLHYALAYAYRRVDVYEGCGSARELVDRQRWFKCNMGWGPDHDPEWHDAESVWFGMTARLWQKKLPN